MKILNGYWVKPHGSGMSCIDTIHGECLYGLSLQECLQECEDSPFCHAGYFIDFKGLPLQSQCVPLNTIQYQNSNFLDSIIDTTNKTRLSSDNGIRVVPFYNEKRYPPDTDLLREPFIFYSDTCFFAQDRGDAGYYYFHSDFSFLPIEQTAMPLLLGEDSSLLFDFDTRISVQSNILFFKQDEITLLSFHGDWSWKPYGKNNLSFSFVVDQSDLYFIDYEKPFWLLNKKRNLYLDTDNTNRLCFSVEKPRYPFFFRFDPYNKTNQVTRINWAKRPLVFPQEYRAFQDSMEQFLCSNFPYCEKHTAQPWIPFSMTFFWVVFSLVIFVWLCIVGIGAAGYIRKNTKKG